VPRPAVERVPYASADWAPDGKELAVIRFVELGQTRLEYPLGKVLYEGRDMTAPRFAPDGDRIAFFQKGKSGSVMVIGRLGDGAKEIASGFDLPGGAPCWRPDGKEVWFTGSLERGRPSGLYAADLDGKVRLVAQMPGELELDDIARDGRALLAHHTIISSMRAMAPGDSAERDLTWLDFPVPAAISTDGKTVLFTESGEGGGKTATVYLRGLDGSPAIRLGEGTALALSPDGKSALVVPTGTADRFVLLPTGAGEPRTISLTRFEALGAAAFLPDGKELVFNGQEVGKKWRVYRLGLAGGKPRPISPEGIGIPFFMTGPVSPDGGFFFGARGPGNWSRFPLEGGEELRIAGLQSGDFPIRWASDRSLWVRSFTFGEVWRLDLLTGRKTPVTRIKPPEANLGVSRLVLSADGRTYVYSARRAHAQLYIVEGLK
jgi:Tol biopolymer transport system component